MVFWDTSALVKAYTNEPGTATVQAAINSLPKSRLSGTDYVALETLTVLTKLLRTGIFSPSEYRKARGQLYRDYPQRFVSIPVKRRIRQQALALAQTHRKAGVGALDLLHLACALEAKAVVHPRPAVLAVVDGPLRRIATLEGLRHLQSGDADRRRPPDRAPLRGNHRGSPQLTQAQHPTAKRRLNADHSRGRGVLWFGRSRSLLPTAR